jgi:hypothetical protein
MRLFLLIVIANRTLRVSNYTKGYCIKVSDGVLIKLVTNCEKLERMPPHCDESYRHFMSLLFHVDLVHYNIMHTA